MTRATSVRLFLRAGHRWGWYLMKCSLLGAALLLGTRVLLALRPLTPLDPLSPGVTTWLLENMRAIPLAAAIAYTIGMVAYAISRLALRWLPDRRRRRAVAQPAETEPPR